MYEQRTFFPVFIILISTVGTGSGLPNTSNETCLIDNTTSLSEMDYNTTLIPKANVHNDDSLKPNPIPTSQPIKYMWDKKISPIDYQQSFCPQRCLNDEVVYINDISNRCPSLTCSKCSCQKPWCELYGICCPEISEPYFPPQGLLSGLFSVFDMKDLVDDKIKKPRRYQVNSKKEVESSKFTGQLGCALDSDSSSFYYIQSCFSTASEELIRQCQIDRRSPDITVDTITYAADNTSGSIYKNRFCAECNGAKQVVKFELILKCIHFMKLYRETDENELLRMALSEESCQITQKVPAHVGIVACDESVILTEPIGKCDQQFSFSEDIVTVCHQLQLPKYAVGPPNYLNYTNIFYKDIDKLTERRSDKDIDKLTERRSDKDIDKLTERRSDKDIDNLTERRSDKDIDNLTERRSDKDIDNLTERRSDKDIDNLTERRSDKDIDNLTERRSDKDIDNLTERRSDKDIDNLTERRSDKDIDNLTERRSDKDIDNLTERRSDKDIDNLTERRSDKDIDNLTERRSDKDIDNLTERRSDKDIDNLTERRSDKNIGNLTERH
ncbi:hypothetical protein Bpfe_014578 [Biomphalaria pfeifferi]|uniref:SMB domain-containing protein n=1 Tax=Biomphalaria pfeifferi TaxID=112525 RepID=A0AAD8FAD5_BIOPF|nr:hypothetical protein Bpfe_014578 [Biomphalaria pfeifferi]